MKVHQIVDFSFDVNLYFIDSPKPVLIDSGLGGDGRRIASYLAQLLGNRKLSAIILTHRHIDHSGGAAELTAKFSTEVFTSPVEADSLIQGDQITTGAISFGMPITRILVKSLGFGSSIDIGERDLKVIHTPGHTSGSICLYHEKTKSIFAGDVVFAHGSVGRWDLPTGDYNQLVQSIEKLNTMGIKNLYPGHGPFVEGNGSEHIELGLNALKSAFW